MLPSRQGLLAVFAVCKNLCIGKANTNALEPFNRINTPITVPCMVRSATKLSGGSATKHSRPAPRHYGIKHRRNDLVFPGQILVRQNRFKVKPGYNVSLGGDQTLTAKTVGFVKFHLELQEGGPGRPWINKYVSVVPLGGDWSKEYAKKVEVMVQRRRQIKYELARARVREPALYFTPRKRHVEPLTERLRQMYKDVQLKPPK